MIFLFTLLLTGISRSAISPDIAYTVHKLRSYCQACHGVGELRFIYSDKDEEVWHYLLSAKSPKSGVLWAKKIHELLDWPTDSAPPSSQDQWMPRGFKRWQLATDRKDGISVRQILLSTIKQALP